MPSHSAEKHLGWISTIPRALTGKWSAPVFSFLAVVPVPHSSCARCPSAPTLLLPLSKRGCKGPRFLAAATGFAACPDKLEARPHEAAGNSGKKPRIHLSGATGGADVNHTERPGGRDDSRIIPFQDRGHGMTTERHAVTFFCARAPARRRRPGDLSPGAGSTLSGR